MKLLLRVVSTSQIGTFRANNEVSEFHFSSMYLYFFV